MAAATAKEKSPETENVNSLAHLLSGLHTASNNANILHTNGIDFSSVNTKVINLIQRVFTILKLNSFLGCPCKTN